MQGLTINLAFLCHFQVKFIAKSTQICYVGRHLKNKRDIKQSTEAMQLKKQKNATIRSHPYQVKNILILTKNIDNLSLDNMYISKDFEELNKSKPMKIGMLSLKFSNP